jgi:hypothetical protein
LRLGHALDLLARSRMPSTIACGVKKLEWSDCVIPEGSWVRRCRPRHQNSRNSDRDFRAETSCHNLASCRLVMSCCFVGPSDRRRSHTLGTSVLLRDGVVACFIWRGPCPRRVQLGAARSNIESIATLGPQAIVAETRPHIARRLPFVPGGAGYPSKFRSTASPCPRLVPTPASPRMITFHHIPHLFSLLRRDYLIDRTALRLSNLEDWI